MKHVISWLWKHKAEFGKYLAVGGSGVVLDLLSLMALREWAGLTPTLAVIISQAFLLTYNFTLNKYWSFNNSERAHGQAVRYGVLAGWNYAFSAGSMWVFAEQLGADYRLVRVVAIAVMVSWNFYLYKHWVYRHTATAQQGLIDGEHAPLETQKQGGII